jgi:hypothetical protein
MAVRKAAESAPSKVHPASASGGQEDEGCGPLSGAAIQCALQSSVWWFKHSIPSQAFRLPQVHSTHLCRCCRKAQRA